MHAYITGCYDLKYIVTYTYLFLLCFYYFIFPLQFYNLENCTFRTWPHITFLYFTKSVILQFVPSFFYLSIFFSLFLCIVFQPLASSSLKSGLGRTKVHSGVKEWKPLILRIKWIRPVLLTFFRAQTPSAIYLFTKTRAISH